jgi:hypothetical protein
MGSTPSSVMFRTFCISLGSHLDSQPEMRPESQRQRCASVTAGPSLPQAAAELTRSRAVASPRHDRTLRLPVTATLAPLCTSLSHLVRACEEASARATALTTTTDHFGRALPSDQGPPQFAVVSRASRNFARRSRAGRGRCTAEGLGNRRCLPPQPHPSLSRSHEEGNVDQRIAAGGMPHRDR